MYLLTKYIKSVLWGVAVRLSYIYDVWCLKVKESEIYNCEVSSLSKFVFYCIYVTTGIRTRDSGIQVAESVDPAANVIVHSQLR